MPVTRRSGATTPPLTNTLFFPLMGNMLCSYRTAADPAISPVGAYELAAELSGFKQAGEARHHPGCGAGGGSQSDAGCGRSQRANNGDVGGSDREPDDEFHVRPRHRRTDQPPAGTFGNAGRGSLRGPAMVNVDTSLFKRIPLKERLNLQFRTEFFNVL